MKTICIETKDPTGHINIYKDIFSNFSKNSNLTFVATEEYLTNFYDVSGVEKIISGNAKKAKGKVTYRIEQIYLIIKALIICKREKADKIVFLSYDTVALFLSLLFFKKNNVFVFEHNNIDQCLSSSVKAWTYKLLSKKVTSYVFEDYIGHFITKNYNRKFPHYFHPLFKIQSHGKVNTIGNYIFMPSTFVCEHDFSKVFEFAQKNQLKIVCKNHDFLKHFCNQKIISNDFFDDYNDLFLNAKFIAILNDFSYRISGVYYEAVANNKNILIKDTIMSRKMEKREVELYYL